MLQGTDRIGRDTPARSLRGGTSLTGTHRAPPPPHAHRRSSGPSHHRRLCCPAAQPVLRPPPTPTRPAIHFPGSPVIGHHAPAARSAGHRAGEGLPSSRRHPRYVPRPMRRGVPHGCAARLFAASMAFAPISRGSALPCPARRRMSNDAAGCASCYGPHRRSPIRASDAGLRPRPFSRRDRQPATGPPGSYPDRTSTGRRRRAYEHEETPWHYVTVSPPALLGARENLIECMMMDVVAAELDRVHELIAGRFARAELRARVREYVSGLVAGLERKNGWTLAEWAGEVSPDGMQRLLRRADWDIDGVRNDVRDYVIEHLGDREGVLIADETGFLKKGTRSAGVQRQFSVRPAVPQYCLCTPADRVPFFRKPVGGGAKAVLRDGGA